ncbi:MAG: hemolysin family protein [Planctomycetota bacterium]
MTLLVIYVALTLGVSFLCSLLEAALLSVPVSSLTERKESGGRGIAALLDFKQRRIDDALSAILTLNTVSNTLGATLAGAQVRKLTDDFWVGVFSGGLTFLILTLSEIIPKTLGTVYARSLAGFVGWTLHILTRIMAPALVLTRALTRMLTRGRQRRISRGELEAIIAMAGREGALSRDESALYANVLRFDEIRVEDVLTPRTVAVMFPAGATIGELLEDPRVEAFSRIPLYEGSPDQVVGYLLMREVLHAVTKGTDVATPLSRFLRETWFIPEVVSLRAALRQFLEHREPLAMVADEHGGLSGLVTLEDVMETILGVEIVDESDRVADLRQAAMKMRQQRLERMEEQHLLRPGGAGSPGGAGPRKGDAAAGKG